MHIHLILMNILFNPFIFHYKTLFSPDMSIYICIWELSRWLGHNWIENPLHNIHNPGTMNMSKVGNILIKKIIRTDAQHCVRVTNFLGFEICVIVSIASGAARGSSEIVHICLLVGSINHYPFMIQSNCIRESSHSTIYTSIKRE